MKFRIDGTVLKTASAIVDVAVNAKSNVPDESHVLIMSDDTNDTLFMCGRNDRYMTTMNNISVDPGHTVSGAVLIHAMYWQKLLGECSGKTVEFESDETTYAKIKFASKSGKSQNFKFNVMPATQYLPLDMHTVVAQCSVDKFQLRDAMRVVRPTADSNNSFDQANGVCLEFDGDQLNMIATDMTTLGFSEIPGVYQIKPAAKVIRVIPKEAVDIVDKIINAMPGNELTISTDGGLVSFKGGPMEMVTLIFANGKEYVTWERVVPDAVDGPTFTAKVGAIMSAMNLAEIVGGGSPLTVDIEIDGSEVTVKSEGQGGVHEGVITTSAVSDKAKFKVDSRLVKNSLRTLDANTDVQVATFRGGAALQVLPTMPNMASSALQIWAAVSNNKE